VQLPLFCSDCHQHQDYNIIIVLVIVVTPLLVLKVLVVLVLVIPSTLILVMLRRPSDCFACSSLLLLSSANVSVKYAKT